MKMKSTIKMPWKAVAFGLLSAGLSVLLSVLFAKLIENGSIQLEQVRNLSSIIHGISALTGCLLSALLAKEKKLVSAAITGATYFLLLCIANGILLRGEFQSLALTLSLIAGAVLLSGLLSAKRKKKY